MELIVAFTILLILSTMALPLARVKVQREKERRLRRALTEIRTAIDRHKDMADQGKLGQVDEDTFGYPLTLESMVEGVTMQATGVGSNPFGQGGRQGLGGQGGRQGLGGRAGRSAGGKVVRLAANKAGRSGAGKAARSVAVQAAALARSRAGDSVVRWEEGSGSQSRGGLGSSRRGSSGMGSDEEGEQKIRFLRRIPLDPVTNSTSWGLRSVQDEPESMSWGGQNVFDVHTTSMDVALDGTRYSEW